MDNIPNDPLFPLQWHLNNTGQSGGTTGEDIRVLDAWSIATGDGVVIGIVDDGLQSTHPDLVNRYLADLSYDFESKDTDPNPSNGEYHGTAVAGIAVAEGNNEIGISGVAYDAKLAGLKIVTTLSNRNTLDAQLAAALSHKNQDIDIYNNSWELNGSLLPLGELTAAAIEDGIENGRDELGNIYVFGAGDDGQTGGNVNYHGLANSRYTIAVGDIDANGVKSPSSNPGASLLVSAYGGANDGGVITTDLQGEAGSNQDLALTLDDDYTHFSGASAATPIVSGVIALMLEANPNLTWRDVQHILVRTAQRNDPDHPDWLYNSAGFLVNHDYGFGAIDAEEAVEVAANWEPLPLSTSYSTGELSTAAFNSSDPETPLGHYYRDAIERDINIEWVEVVINPRTLSSIVPQHNALDKDVTLVLTSPSGTKSVLSQNPPESTVDNSNNGWTFTTARHWGETSLGNWTLTSVNSQSTAEVKIRPNFDWELNFYGTSSFYPITPGYTDRIQDGIENGRSGLGNIYVFGAGDEGETGGNVNYDPLANSRYTIAVGEIDANGVKSPSSNPGASLLVAAEGDNNPQLSGTEGAADLVSDVTALMLEVNPELTWRDVQHILVGTATQNDPDHPDWIYNSAGFLVNHNYGFGAVDVETAVNVAANWEPLQPSISYSTGERSPIWLSSRGPETPLGYYDSDDVEQDLNIEWVEVVVTPDLDVDVLARHDALDKDAKLILTSPSGTKSVLSQNPPDPAFDHPNNSWTFTTARHWGESSLGTWTLTAVNSQSTAEEKIPPDFNWELNFYGADYPIEPFEPIDFIAPDTPRIQVEDLLPIEDDEPITNPDPELSINNVSLAEGNEDNTEFIFTVSLDKASTKTITVDYATADDGATAGGDYTAVEGALEFAPGEIEKTITVPVIGDIEVEEDETFTINLSNPSEAAIANSQGTGLIENDDVDLSPLTLTGNTAQIAYVAYYGRPGDGEGLEFWNDTLSEYNVSYAPREGDSLTGQQQQIYNDIVNQFGTAAEADRLFGSLTNRDAVDRVYQLAFNRDGDNNGLDYWTEQIELGGVTLATFALEIALGAQNEDIVVLKNKIESADLFTNSIDTQAEIDAYQGSEGEIFGRDWLSEYGLTASSQDEINLALNELV